MVCNRAGRKASRPLKSDYRYKLDFTFHIVCPGFDGHTAAIGTADDQTVIPQYDVVDITLRAFPFRSGREGELQLLSVNGEHGLHILARCRINRNDNG